MIDVGDDDLIAGLQGAQQAVRQAEVVGSGVGTKHDLFRCTVQEVTQDLAATAEEAVIVLEVMNSPPALALW